MGLWVPTQAKAESAKQRSAPLIIVFHLFIIQGEELKSQLFIAEQTRIIKEKFYDVSACSRTGTARSRPAARHALGQGSADHAEAFGPGFVRPVAGFIALPLRHEQIIGSVLAGVGEDLSALRFAS